MITEWPCPRLTEPGPPAPRVLVWPSMGLPPWYVSLYRAREIAGFPSTQACTRWCRRHGIQLVPAVRRTDRRTVRTYVLPRPEYERLRDARQPERLVSR